MKIIFVDTEEQISTLNNLKDDNLIIISLKPHCSYILKKKKIDYFQLSDFYDQKKEWSNYINLTNNVAKVINRLNQLFAKEYEKLHNFKWNIYEDFFYIIKIWHDTLHFHSLCLNKIIKKFNPKEIHFSTKTDLSINNNLLISSKTNVIEILAQKIDDIEIKYLNLNTNNKLSIDKKFSFGQPKDLLTKTFFNRYILNLKKKVSFYYKFYFKKFEYLSIGSDEVEFYNKNRIKKIKILNLNFESKIRFEISEINHKKIVDEDIVLADLLNNHLINYKDIFVFLIVEISKQIKFYFEEYKKFEKFIKKEKFKAIIFQSMAPYFYPITISRKLANNQNIPYLTWVHGGYFSLSNPGYDISDYKFCKNHIGYGEYLKDLIYNNKDNSMNTINDKVNFNVDYVGSFKFDTIHNKKKEDNLQKPVITFFIGGYMDMSSFYYGYNRENVVTSLWKEQFEIIQLLSSYSHKYKIIIKDYPEGYPELWKKIINLEGYENIKYISNEKDVQTVFSESDLNIFPWASTTFFEALYYDADLCLLEDDLYDKPFINEFNDSCIWSKDIETFKKNLKKYLDKGDFYLFNKDRLRNYFINFDENFEEKEKRLIKTLKSLR